MSNRQRKLLSEFQLETLEGRIVQSATAQPLHALHSAARPAHVAPVHSATTQKAPAIPNPVLVDLTPTTTSIKITDVSYDSRINLITVKGTVKLTNQSPYPGYPYYYYQPNYPATAYITVAASEAIDRFRSVSGSQYTNVPIPDTKVTTVPFTEHILASSGMFKGGNVVLAVSESDSNYYYYSTKTVIARMRNAKAY